MRCFEWPVSTLQASQINSFITSLYFVLVEAEQDSALDIFNRRLKNRQSKKKKKFQKFPQRILKNVGSTELQIIYNSTPQHTHLGKSLIYKLDK